MFAILLSEEMDPFYQNVSSFPTVLFTIALGVCVAFWLFAVLGIVDIDVLDMDISTGSDAAGPNAVAGLLLRFNLGDVPVTIVLTVMSLVGWLVSYFAVYLLFPWIPGSLLEFIVGIPIVFVALFAGLLVTAAVVRPLKPLFAGFDTADEHKTILGQMALVRSTEVNGETGEVALTTDGAELILKARSVDGAVHLKGEQVVLLDHDEVANVYSVITESDFLGK